jgi:hypothetical protein
MTISNASTFIRGKIEPDSVIHSDAWRGYYTGLVDLAIKSIIVSIMERISLPMGDYISMALSLSGSTRKGDS